MKKALFVALIGVFGLALLPSCCCKKQENVSHKTQKMCKTCGMPASKCKC